jgi:hypothetical protein
MTETPLYKGPDAVTENLALTRSDREIGPEVYWNPAPATMGYNKLLN